MVIIVRVYQNEISFSAFILAFGYADWCLYYHFSKQTTSTDKVVVGFVLLIISVIMFVCVSTL